MYFEAPMRTLAFSGINSPRQRGYVPRASFWIVVAALCGPAAWWTPDTPAGETYRLRRPSAPDVISRVQVSLDVQGHLYSGPPPKGEQAKAAGPGSLPIRVAARLAYDERSIPTSSPDDSSAEEELSAVRYYRAARAEILVDTTKETPELRPDRRFIVAQSEPSGVTLYCPHGPLTRAELDLIEIPASSHLLHTLLPEERVRIGQSWGHTDGVVGRLFLVDSISSNTVRSTLAQVQRNVARVRLQGALRGRAPGADVAMEIEGEYRFDLGRHRISWLQLSIRERRAAGHAMPGFQVTADLRVRSVPADSPSELDGSGLDGLVGDSEAGHTLLDFTSEQGAYQFMHDRRWCVVDERPAGTVLRLVDQGDLLAQCNVSELPDLPPGRQIGLEEFQQDIQQSLAKRFGQFEHAGQFTREDGLRVLRVVALGTVDKLPIRWIYYHISTPRGRRAAQVYTMEADLAEQFGDSDQLLTGSFHFLEREGEGRQEASDGLELPAPGSQHPPSTAKSGKDGVISAQGPGSSLH